MVAQESDSILLDEKAVAVQLGLKRDTLRMWRYHGKGPSWIRIGHRTIRYTQKAVDAYLMSRTHAQEDSDGALPQG